MKVSTKTMERVEGASPRGTGNGSLKRVAEAMRRVEGAPGGSRTERRRAGHERGNGARCYDYEIVRDGRLHPGREDAIEPGGSDGRPPDEPPEAARGDGHAARSAAGIADEAARGFVTEGVDLFYGSFKAVEGVTLEIEPNKVTALIGSSGCGKTTFLRSLNRMHELTAGATVSGRIALDGIDIYDPGIDPVAVRRNVGMVFQSPNPFPTMSIYENVAAGLTLNNRRMSKSDRDDVVERSLRGAHLWNEVKDRLDKPGGGLSGGQQQRLCIARAIAVEPEVLLMDEPCSALDPVATLAIEDLIGELKRRFTIVIVTHNMQQAARASDVTAFFNLERTGDPGRLVEIDETATIFSNPSREATEAYVSGRFG